VVFLVDDVGRIVVGVVEILDGLHAVVASAIVDLRDSAPGVAVSGEVLVVGHGEAEEVLWLEGIAADEDSAGVVPDVFVVGEVAAVFLNLEEPAEGVVCEGDFAGVGVFEYCSAADLVICGDDGPGAVGAECLGLLDGSDRLVRVVPIVGIFDFREIVVGAGLAVVVLDGEEPSECVVRETNIQRAEKLRPRPAVTNSLYVLSFL